MELRAQIVAEYDAARAIVNAAISEGRGLSDEERQKKESHEAKAKELEERLKLQQEADALESRADEHRNAPTPAPRSQRTTADDGTHDDDPEPEESRTRVEVSAPKYELGDALGALVMARFRFGTNQDAAKKFARTAYGERSLQMRAMQQSVFTAGGALLGDNFLGNELIELLRATAAVRRAGARPLPLVNGTATIPKITGGATSHWGAEGSDITASQMSAGQLKLVEKKLTSLVPISNDLRRKPSVQVDRMVRDDMVRSAANAEDLGFLRGQGDTNQPKGIYHWVGDAGRTNSAGTTLAQVRQDIRTAKNRLGNANAPMVRRAWFMHSRASNYMGWDLVDGNSIPAFPQMQGAEAGNVMLGGAAVFVDNNIPITLGGGTDSEIYYVEMSEFFIGDSPEIEIEIIENAAYIDSSGGLVSGTSRDESVIRLIRKTDCAMRHVESAHVTEAVAYGA